MKRRWIFPAFSAILAIGLILAGAWGYQQAKAKSVLGNKLEGGYQRAFQDLTANVEQISVGTGKILVSSSRDQTIMNLTDVWRQASVAQANLGLLPLSRLTLDRTEQFLAQVGDFASVMARLQAQGQDFTKEEITTLEKIRTQTKVLATELGKLQQGFNKKGLRWSEVDDMFSRQIRDVDKNFAVDGFTNIEKSMTDYPTLVYDGPFSDSVLNRKPVGVTGSTVTREEALKIAKNFLGADRIKAFNADYAGGTGGKIPAYTIAFTPKNGDENRQIYVEVSKQGGHVVWMLDQRLPGGQRLSVDECQKKAAAFLAERGYPNMEVTSTLEYQNTIAYSYSYTQENVIIYPDMIKLEVARDNGDVVGFDARDYLTSHHQRALPEPKIPLDQAKDSVSKRLQIERERLTVIPLNNGKEALCYEFKGTAMGEEYLVYINVENGHEENILRIVRTQEGLLSV